MGQDIVHFRVGSCDHMDAHQFANLFRCRRARIELILPPNSLTTDNAAMIAFAGLLHARAGEFSPLNTPVDPNMKLAGAQARV